jgi:hypothetical protein
LGSPALFLYMLSIMASGTVTLGEFARHLAILDVACSKCERRGRYKVAELMKRHGADAKLPDLCDILAADCPRINSAAHDGCSIYYPQLSRL